jgi:5-methylthioadenosine/S-adenosylhomocysteine deaminase
MTLLRGFADDLPLETWWFKKIFPAEAKLTRQDVYWGSMLGGLEMIRSGTTTFVDFYFYIDEIAKAVEHLGLRANIGIPVLDFSGPEFKSAAEVFFALPKIIKRWEKNDLIQFSIAPHMIQTASLKNYKLCRKFADKHRVILQTHLAETKKEVKFALNQYNKTPVKLLAENKIFNRHTILAHANWIANEKISLLAKNNTSVCHCPNSNMKLASGKMPLKKLYQSSINVCLGTDGPASNNSLDIFSEMKSTALLHKLLDQDPTTASAQTVLDMATINGAKALGLEREIGSIEKGKKADIIIVDFNQPHLTPCYNPISNLVYAARGADVKTSIVNGKILMENKKLIKINEQDIFRQIKQICEKLT